MADPVIRTGHINLFAQSDVTCYIIRGAEGDLLVDTGFYMNRRALLQWLSVYSVKWIFLTHAHPDHDWNAAAVAQKTGAKILLHEADVLFDSFLRNSLAVERIGVVAVNALEEQTLAVNGDRLPASCGNLICAVDLSACEAYLAEAQLCGNYLLHLALVVFESEDESVEVGSLGRPELGALY